MKTNLLKAFLLISFVFVSGLYTHALAGKIDLDNSSSTTLSQAVNPFIFHHTQFSRFSLTGPLVQTSFGTSSLANHFGPASVSVFSLADYGITNQNIGQLGSLLQIQVSGFGFPPPQVTLFLIDPITLQQITVGSQTFQGINFNVSDFGALPQNITPDFYIGVRAFTVVTSGGNTGGSVSILSTVPTPEPTSLVLLASGLSGAGLLARRRLRRKA